MLCVVVVLLRKLISDLVRLDEVLILGYSQVPFDAITSMETVLLSSHHTSRLSFLLAFRIISVCYLTQKSDGVMNAQQLIHLDGVPSRIAIEVNYRMKGG